MRKQTKLVAVLSTAALLAIGASMTSFAAQGWAEEDRTWVYYDKNGDKVNETWKKYGDNWYWLDDNGEMATDSLIDNDGNYYYVDVNGVMVSNQWVAIENEDAGEEDEPEVWWYYFQSNGKAYKKSDNASSISLKTINGKKYSFDDEGKMHYGWVDDDGTRQTDDDTWRNCQYYFGDENDGAMSVGWRLIDITDSNFENDQPDPNGDTWDEEQTRWFWFKSSGKKQTDKMNKTINGKKYGFDEDGRMIASWYTDDLKKNLKDGEDKVVSPTATTSQTQGIASYSNTFMYFNDPESGARYTKGWFKVVPGYYLQQGKYDDGDEYWYYADGNGKIYANQIKTIKGKKYAFDEYDRMISGLVFLSFNEADESTDIMMKFADDAKKGNAGKALDADQAKDNMNANKTNPYDTEDNFDDFVNNYQKQIAEGTIRCYYFGSSDDGAMKTGRQNVTIDGDTFAFEFEKAGARKGAGKVGLKDNKLYLAGKQVKADKDDKYSVYKITKDGDEIVAVEKMEAAEFIKDAMGDADKKITNSKTTYTWKPADDSDMTEYLLISSSGTVCKNKSGAKDGNDYKFTVDSSRKITKVVLDN